MSAEERIAFLEHEVRELREKLIALGVLVAHLIEQHRQDGVLTPITNAEVFSRAFNTVDATLPDPSRSAAFSMLCGLKMVAGSPPDA